MTFKEYVKEWFDEFLEDHKESADELFKAMLFTDDDLIDARAFWSMILPKVVEELGIKYNFVKDMIDDIEYHCEQYDDPVGYFQDLQHGGCMSGTTSIFMYFDETKKFYIEHMEHLDNFAEDLEEEFGEPIRNKNQTPRYVFVCMLCHEELAHKIGCELFPNEL